MKETSNIIVFNVMVSNIVLGMIIISLLTSLSKPKDHNRLRQKGSRPTLCCF